MSADLEIPAPLAHTALAMDEAICAKARNGDSAGVPMSSATSECTREIWYGFRWCADGEAPTGPQQRRFRTGLQYERWLLDDLRSTGADVLEYDETTGKQHSVQLADGHLRGKIDGLATGVVEAPQTQHVVECKSMKAADFRAVVKHGLREAKPDHWVQCQLYMHGLGVKRSLYICANKDTDEIHTVRLEYDSAGALGIEAKVMRVVDAAEPPARASEKKDAFVCRFCKAKEICHSGAWPRVNCRTCLSSSPGPGGTWRCERHLRALSYKDQQAGCPDHRYIPALVAGEQVDVLDGDLIVYRMKDGVEWVDGAGGREVVG